METDMSKHKDLSFIDNNPGTAKFGNFINYYSFHSSIERISNLHPDMFPPSENEQIYCLDIGCNTGELTRELAIYMKSVYQKSVIKILAVDIDPTLIQRAQEQNKSNDIFFMTSDITTASGCELVKDFLHKESKNKFDVIFCFSVTMWIHLNYGDIGLQNFLIFLKEHSILIIIEPQPWKCYKNAQRRMKRSGKSFELYEDLKIRDNVDEVIESILIDKTHFKTYESTPSTWNRRIQSYYISRIN